MRGENMHGYSGCSMSSNVLDMNEDIEMPLSRWIKENLDIYVFA